MRRKWLTLTLATAVGATAVVATWALRPATSEDLATSADLRDSLPVCVALQASSIEPSKEALECMEGALVASVSAGTFGASLDELAPYLAVSAVSQQCHAAGHRAGVVLLGMFTFDEALDRMFGARTHLPEPVCGTAVIHGLIQAFVAGDPPYDFAYLTDQCRSLDRVSPGYATECAHYVGHAAWKQVGALDAELSRVCSSLAGVAGRDAELDCIAGAVMQKYKLQDKGYILDAPMTIPPALGEVVELCEPLRSGRAVAFEGCWGGVGWLMSQRVEFTIEQEQLSADSSSGRSAIVAAYADAVESCELPACVARVVSHMRADFYPNGVAQEVCATAVPPSSVSTETFNYLCDRALAVRSGDLAEVAREGLASRPDSALSSLPATEQ